MRRYIALLALGFSQAIAATPPAAMSLIQGDTQITLNAGKCSNAVILAMLTPESRQHFRAGSMVYEKKTYTLCWRIGSGEYAGQVFLVDDTGDHGFIPLSAFKPATVI